jgi:formate hydrogenlyase subunit 3/multisubunit Na+/H+ antiporter MnhD subunit
VSVLDKLYPWFKLDTLNGFVALAIGLFSVLTLLYSSRYMRGKRGVVQYYVYITLTAITAVLAVLSNNLALLLMLWGFLGLTLYLLIIMGDKDSDAAAKKTFIIIGGSDALMLFGIGIIYYMTGTFQMDKIRLSVVSAAGGSASGGGSYLSLIAYLCLAIACFAKAGAMPFHSWVPECAKSAPTPVAAYLPASLDKLLGVYLLARVSLDMFVMNGMMNAFLMLLGAITIIVAVMMALIQHNMKRLLGYHAVSQVGYMVLGIGTGTAIGIAGGMFHMLNNAIYKSCLFLTGGNVEYRAHTTELDELGGLGKLMPLTYVACLIASLSISGIPPFNGFVSKWMIYQGLIGRLQVADGRWHMIIPVFCLAAAMFGSALTVASFMKLLHATFLGRDPADGKYRDIREVSWVMWLPCIILAGLCVIFGIFAYQIPLRYFILPITGKVSFIGEWSALLATALIIIGLGLGMALFNWKVIRPSLRRDAAYTGSETVALPETRVTGTEFYNTVREYGVLKRFYKNAEAGLFDVYEQGKNVVFGIGGFLRYLHNGVLPTYLVWILLGMIALFFTLVK